VLAPGAPLVDARELERPIAEAPFARPPAGEVKGPPVERRAFLVERAKHGLAAAVQDRMCGRVSPQR
jgi:hypothetical protein